MENAYPVVEKVKAFRVDKTYCEDGTEKYQALTFYLYSNENYRDTYEEAIEDGKTWLNKPDLEPLPEHQQRLVWEVEELAQKIDKLNAIIENWDNLDFEPDCSKEELASQLKSMGQYMNSLQGRTDVKRLQQEGYIEKQPHYIIEGVN